MNIKLFRICTISFLMVFAGLNISRAETKGGLSSPLTVTIKMTKAEYEVLKETIDGEIIITNSSMVSFPVLFDIKLFKDDVFKYHAMTAIKSFLSGENKFSFKDFGIPDIGSDPDSAGHWRLVIIQKDVDPSYAAKAEFVIQPAGGK